MQGNLLYTLFSVLCLNVFFCLFLWSLVPVFLKMLFIYSADIFEPQLCVKPFRL